MQRPSRRLTPRLKRIGIAQTTLASGPVVPPFNGGSGELLCVLTWTGETCWLLPLIKRKGILERLLASCLAQLPGASAPSIESDAFEPGSFFLGPPRPCRGAWIGARQ
jgi:hypothetical protein